jgi:hypothetical protein
LRRNVGSRIKYPVSGGDGGELNSLKTKSLVYLILILLDQIMAIGKTAKQVKGTIRDTSNSS